MKTWWWRRRLLLGVTAQTIGFQLNEFSWNRVLFILSVLYRCFEMTAAHTLTHSSVDTPHRITGFLSFILLHKLSLLIRVICSRRSFFKEKIKLVTIHWIFLEYYKLAKIGCFRYYPGDFLPLQFFLVLLMTDWLQIIKDVWFSTKTIIQKYTCIIIIFH